MILADRDALLRRTACGANVPSLRGVRNAEKRRELAALRIEERKAAGPIDPRQHVALAMREAKRHAAKIGGLPEDYVGIAYTAMAEAAQTYDPALASWSTYAVRCMRCQLVTQTSLEAYLVTGRRRSSGGSVMGGDAGEALAAAAGAMNRREHVPDLPEFVRAKIAELVDGLPQRERAVAIASAQGLRLHEIGHMLGVSRERVRQLRARIAERLMLAGLVMPAGKVGKRGEGWRA